MYWTRFITLLAAALCIFAGGAATTGHAQEVTYEGCVDPWGVQVASIESRVDNVAIATRLANGAPVIYYNPQVVSWFRDQTKLFWYAHECAHHVLGHTMGMMHVNQERDADCWAIQTLVRDGWLRDGDLEVILGDISQVPGDGWLYLPGPQRSMHLLDCLDTSGDYQRPSTFNKAKSRSGK